MHSVAFVLSILGFGLQNRSISPNRRRPVRLVRPIMRVLPLRAASTCAKSHSCSFISMSGSFLSKDCRARSSIWPLYYMEASCDPGGSKA